MPEFSPAFLHSLNFVIRPDVEGGYVNDPATVAAKRNTVFLTVATALLMAKPMLTVTENLIPALRI